MEASEEKTASQLRHERVEKVLGPISPSGWSNDDRLKHALMTLLEESVVQAQRLDQIERRLAGE